MKRLNWLKSYQSNGQLWHHSLCYCSLNRLHSLLLRTVACSVHVQIFSHSITFQLDFIFCILISNLLYTNLPFNEFAGPHTIRECLIIGTSNSWTFCLIRTQKAKNHEDIDSNCKFSCSHKGVLNNHRVIKVYWAAAQHLPRYPCRHQWGSDIWIWW
jgi:hypothetical protein